jgi:hypothetical protein
MEATLRKARELFPKILSTHWWRIALEGKTQRICDGFEDYSKGGDSESDAVTLHRQGFVDYLAKYAQDVLVPGSLGTVMEL